MSRNGKQCTTWSWAYTNRCNSFAAWREAKYCQLSCFVNGNGYPGDVCCTTTPTGAPSHPPPSPPLPVATSPTTAPAAPPLAAPPCVACTDTPTSDMDLYGRDCSWQWGLDNKCAPDAYWLANHFCQLSCYLAGKGYPGDACCPAPPVAPPPPPRPPLPPPCTECTD
eukprot:2003486-Prymnesium_polylepis.1